MKTVNSYHTRGRITVALLLVVALSCLHLAGCLPWQTNGGMLRLWDRDPMTLDPAIVSDFSSYSYVVHVFSGLVRLDHDLEIVPDIAESWEKSADGMTYTFHLRPGVEFHGGREVKAADFKYSWERACHPDTGSGTADTYLGDIVGAGEMLRGEAESLAGVEVIDEHTLRVTIDAPKAYFLNKMAYPTAFVVDEDNVEPGSDWWRQPDGTGPFKLKEWQKGEYLLLERNDSYYGDPARVESIVFILAGPPMPMYELGYIDVAPVYGGYIYRVSDEAGPLHKELAVTSELSLYYIGFNTAEPPFDDINVRLAFSHAVDKDRIAELVLRDMLTVAGGILPPEMPGYNEGLEGVDYDVEKAKEYIASSRYGDVSNLPPITMTVSGYGNLVPEYLGAIIEEWEQNLGVTVSVRQLESERFLYNLKEEKDQMFVLGWIADYPDPHNFLDILFYTGSENNYFEYSNPDLDALLDRAAVEQDDALRMAMYQQAEQMVVADAACFPLWHGDNYIVVKPHVTGYELGPLGIPDLSRVSVGDS